MLTDIYCSELWLFVILIPSSDFDTHSENLVHPNPETDPDPAMTTATEIIYIN